MATEKCVPHFPCYFEKWPTDLNLNQDKVCKPIDYIINNNSINIPYTNTGIPCKNNQEVFFPIDSDPYNVCDTKWIPLNNRVFAKTTIENVQNDGSMCTYTLKPFNYTTSDETEVKCPRIGVVYQHILPRPTVFENRTRIIGV